MKKIASIVFLLVIALPSSAIEKLNFPVGKASVLYQKSNQLLAIGFNLPTGNKLYRASLKLDGEQITPETTIYTNASRGKDMLLTKAPAELKGVFNFRFNFVPATNGEPRVFSFKGCSAEGLCYPEERIYLTF
jgi:thiol:disulfide interchange protein